MTKQPGAALPPEAAQLQQQQVRVMALTEQYDKLGGLEPTKIQDPGEVLQHMAYKIPCCVH